MQILVHSGICLVQIKSHISLVDKTIFYQITQFALPELMLEPKSEALSCLTEKVPLG